MSYTLTELIEKLQDLADEYPELAEQEVNMAFQQNYPLAGLITSVTVVESEDEDAENCTDECKHGSLRELWIGTKDNRHTPYAPGEAWND